MNPDGWEGLQLADPEISHKQQVDTIEQPTWYPGEDASHGFAREGQNSLVREIERRMKRAREL